MTPPAAELLTRVSPVAHLTEVPDHSGAAEQPVEQAAAEEIVELARQAWLEVVEPFAEAEAEPIETVAAERPVSGVLPAERVSAGVAEPVGPVAAELLSAARLVEQTAVATLPVQVLSFSDSERT